MARSDYTHKMVDGKRVDLTEEEIQACNELILKTKEKILCKHCRRTATNGIRCLGMCVADNDY